MSKQGFPCNFLGNVKKKQKLSFQVDFHCLVLHQNLCMICILKKRINLHLDIIKLAIAVLCYSKGMSSK